MTFQQFYRKFGAGSCSDQSMEGFLHMWRVIGYYLGVQDKYNIVRPTLSETRSLLMEIGHLVIIPSMINLNKTSLHMAKCICRAYNIDYHLSIYIHCYGCALIINIFSSKTIFTLSFLFQLMVLNWINFGPN
jgi:hypothetical protein